MTVTDVLIASDATWIVDEVSAVLIDADTTVRVVNTGAAVRNAVKASAPDLVVLDLQIGNMGGMATCIDLHLEAGAGRLPEVPVADVARPCGRRVFGQELGGKWLADQTPRRVPTP